MSGVTSTSSNQPPLTDDEKSAVRHYLGYEFVGTGPTFDPFGRTFSQAPRLEYVMNNIAPPELAIVRQWLIDLLAAETGLRAAQANLDTASAAVWTHNTNEVTDRRQHFMMLRRQFASDLGVPGIRLSRGNTATLIV